VIGDAQGRCYPAVVNRGENLDPIGDGATQIGQRPHGRNAGWAGLVLCASSVLPCYEASDIPVYGYTNPWMLPLYGLGVLAFFLSRAETPPQLLRGVVAARVAAWLPILALVGLFSILSIAAGGIMLITLGLPVVGLFGVVGKDEKSAARVVVATAIVNLGVFAAIISSGDAVAGAYVAAGAATWMLIGGIGWRRQIRARPREGLAAAIVRPR
jgi:hypothetical protein